MPTGRVLVVDDDSEARNNLCDVLSAAACDVRAADSGVSAIRVLEGFTPDVLLVNVDIPSMNGRRLISALRESGEPPFAVIAMSASIRETASPARWLVRKPFDIDLLISLVRDFAARPPRARANAPEDR